MKFHVVLLASLALASAQVFVDQSNYDVNVDHPEIDDHQSRPIPKPTDDSSKWLHVLSDPEFEGYSVRVRRITQPGFCDDVVQYSGYFDDENTDKHFFFWFFESRFEPRLDPVVLWLNGGPGCSSLLGLLMELGPCSLEGNGTKPNPYSWNSFANVFFLDQPQNVGFSHGPGDVATSVEAAKDTWIFLQLFFRKFKHFAKLPFHIAGESYAGHFIPAIASEILAFSTAKSLSAKTVPINLESIMIGNGWTDALHQFPTYPEFARENDILDEDVIQTMEKSIPRCESLIESCYKNPKSPFTCLPAGVYCNRVVHQPYRNTGLNPYDIRVPCEGGGLCYGVLDDIAAWANLEEVRAELGVDPEVKEYKYCSDSVNMRFFMNGDFSKPLVNDIPRILDSGVRVLIYAGDKDWICQWIGNKAWTLQLEWSGKTDYVKAKDEAWFSWMTLKEAGEVRSAGNLTFLRVFDAGHMVPYDQPENSLDFMLKWIRGVSLGSTEPFSWKGKKFF